MADDWGLMENYDEPAHCGGCEGELEWSECEQCGGEGVSGHDCGEDVCCCLEPEENDICAQCGGAGGWYFCPECEHD